MIASDPQKTNSTYTIISHFREKKQAPSLGDFSLDTVSTYQKQKSEPLLLRLFKRGWMGIGPLS